MSRQGNLSLKIHLLTKFRQAFQDVHLALDFISLLLTKVSPVQANISLSDHVKQHVPSGVLGADKISAPYFSPSDTASNLNQITSGWKLQGLNSAADALLQSASRLENEIKKEARYWDQILQVSEEKLTISKLPRERHSLCVRYGFSESTQEFKDRGTAALRLEEDGNVLFDQGITASSPRAVRIRIEENGQEIGASEIPLVLRDNTLTSSLIYQASNSLFEEELFYELVREARGLTSQGIRIRDGAVVLSIPPKLVVIDLVDLPLKPSTSRSGCSELPLSSLAEAIIIALRILLAHAHTLNLQARSVPPPPLSERKITRPSYALLRPVLTYLNYFRARLSLKRFLSALLSPFAAAGLETSLDASIASTDLSSHNTKDRFLAYAEDDCIAPTDVVQSFLEPLTLEVLVSLPPNLKVRIKAQTQYYPHALGTSYSVSISSFHSSRNSSPSAPGTLAQLSQETPSFSTLEDLSAFMCHLAGLALTEVILNYSASRQAVNGLQGSWDTDESAPGVEGWRALVGGGPIGELEKRYKRKGKWKKLGVKVDVNKAGKGAIRVSWGWLASENTDGKSRQVGEVEWIGNAGGADSEKRTFKEVIQEAGRFELGSIAERAATSI